MSIRPLACVLFLLASLSAACAGQTTWQGTWAATIGSGGTTFAGTWNASLDKNPGKNADTVTGAWSLRDANGTELATGTWAAVKEGNLWKGSWQARRASGQTYNGAWKASVDLPANSHFSALFEAALTKAVSGTWNMATYAAGAWTVRAYASQ